MTGRYSPRLWIVSGMTTLAFMSQAMKAPLTPLLALELGAGPLVVGLVVSAAFLLPLFLAMPIGAIVDSWGTREMARWGCLLAGLGPMGVAVSPSFLTLVASQLMVGLGTLMVIVAAQTYVGNLGRGKSGEGNFAWYTTFISAGGLAGPILGGVVYDLHGFRVAFGLAGILPLAGILLSGFLGPRQGTRTRLSDLAPFGRPGQIKQLLGSDAVRVAMVVSCGVLFAIGSIGAFLPVYLESLAVPATLIGILVSMRSAASMVIRPFMGQIIAFLGGRTATFLLATFVVGVAVCLTGFTESLFLLFILVLAIGAGVGFTQPISMVVVADHVNPRERGFALGLRLTGNRVVQLISPLSLGLVAEFFGFRAAFLVGGLVLIASIPLIARWGPSAEVKEAPVDSKSASPPHTSE